MVFAGFAVAIFSARLHRVSPRTALWGLNPAGYHWVNILLHAANALLVWRLLRRLSVPGAWLAAAIFALHPVQVESVAWVTELKNVLSLFFFLLAVLAWVEFVEDRPKPLWRFYALALMFYALALFSKTTACTLPAALLLLLWLQGKPIGWFRLAQIVPFSCWAWAWDWSRSGGSDTTKAVRGPFGTRPAGPLSHRQPRGLVLRRQTALAGKPDVQLSALDNSSCRSARLRMAGGVRRGVRRDLVRPAICRARRRNAALFYVATLSPLLGFIMLYTFRYSFVADHYQYVASIGPIALAAAGMTIALGRLKKQRPFLQPAIRWNRAVGAGSVDLASEQMYADAETLWRTTIARNPDAWMAYDNLGIIFSRKGEVDQAMALFQKTLAIRPDDTLARNNLGLVLCQKERMDEGIVEFQTALSIVPGNAVFRNNLGKAFLAKGQPREAMIQFQKVLEQQSPQPKGQLLPRHRAFPDRAGGRGVGALPKNFGKPTRFCRSLGQSGPYGVVAGHFIRGVRPQRPQGAGAGPATGPAFGRKKSGHSRHPGRRLCRERAIPRGS